MGCADSRCLYGVLLQMFAFPPFASLFMGPVPSMGIPRPLSSTVTGPGVPASSALMVAIPVVPSDAASAWSSAVPVAWVPVVGTVTLGVTTTLGTAVNGVLAPSLLALGHAGLKGSG
jgi:hypothetical protein